MNAIRDLANSRNPLIAAIFGVQTSPDQYDIAFNLRALQRAEQSVYGAAGLEAYEARRPPEHARLMRRSFAQYLCQRTLSRKRWVLWVHALLGGMMLIPLVLWLLIRHTLRREIRAVTSVDTVIFAHFEQFKHVFAPHYPSETSAYLYGRDGNLAPADLTFLLRAFASCPRALLYPAFLASVARWIADYGHSVRLYRPRCVANLFEGSPAAAIATAYLHEHGIRHHNHMHGERFFFAGHSFCEFDEFHVWGVYFRDLFIRLRCSPWQFVVSGNAYHRHLFQTIRRAPREPQYRHFLVVHNQILSPQSLYFRNLVHILKTLDRGWEVRVRMHYNERSHGEAFLQALQRNPELRQRGLRILEEPGAQLALESSLEWSTVVIGAYTTVLLEAWIAGRKVIHVGGALPRSVFMERYGGSANVVYADGTTNIEPFLNEPASLNEEEDQLVRAVSVSA